MPTYSFRNKKTLEEWEEHMTMTEKDKFLRKNKDVEQILVNPVAFGDPVRLGFKKPDEGFREILRGIKRKYKGSKVNTF